MEDLERGGEEENAKEFVDKDGQDHDHKGKVEPILLPNNKELLAVTAHLGKSPIQPSTVNTPARCRGNNLGGMDKASPLRFTELFIVDKDEFFFTIFYH